MKLAYSFIIVGLLIFAYAVHNDSSPRKSANANFSAQNDELLTPKSQTSALKQSEISTGQTQHSFNASTDLEMQQALHQSVPKEFKANDSKVVSQSTQLDSDEKDPEFHELNFNDPATFAEISNSESLMAQVMNDPVLKSKWEDYIDAQYADNTDERDVVHNGAVYVSETEAAQYESFQD